MTTVINGFAYLPYWVIPITIIIVIISVSIMITIVKTNGDDINGKKEKKT